MQVTAGGMTKSQDFWPGTVALGEICCYRSRLQELWLFMTFVVIKNLPSTQYNSFLIHKLSFLLVRETAQYFKVQFILTHRTLESDLIYSFIT